MIKNDPYKLLKKEEISKSLLSDTGKKALTLFDRAKSIQEQFQKDENILSQANAMGKKAIEVLEEEIARIKDELKNTEEGKAKAKQRKSQSKKLIQKSQKILDELEQCRLKLREDRERKIESGEIKKPVRKKLTTRLRLEMVKIANMIPKSKKEDPEVVRKTEKAIKTFIGEIKGIWGINQIAGLEEELKEKFDKMRDDISKKEEKKAA